VTFPFTPNTSRELTLALATGAVGSRDVLGVNGKVTRHDSDA
jgi:hypothetical protein